MRPNRTIATRSAALLAYDDCQGSAVAAMAEILDIANMYAARGERGAPPAFRWQVVSPDGAPPRPMGGVRLTVEGAAAQLAAPDLIFVPGLHYTGDARLFARQVDALVAHCGGWLAEQHRRGAVLAASCGGVFALAEAGLLAGRRATTSWWLGTLFRSRYPDVILCEGDLVTRDGQLLSSGAFTACLDLALQLVEHFLGPALALSCAKVMMIDARHDSQFPFMTLQARMQHSDELVLRAQSRIRARVRDELSIEDLARGLEVSARTLNRRFHEALGCSPREYLQEVRVDGAKRLLETTDLSLEAITEQVGYGDLSSFRRLFERITKVSPSQYRRMFAPDRSARTRAGSAGRREPD